MKWVPVWDWVREDDSVWASVVVGGDSSEPVLPGGVPESELDFLVLDLHVLDFEVHSDGWVVAQPEVVFSESQKNVGFAYCGISNDD